MKKNISLILFLFLASFMKAADADWRIHPIFDEEVAHVVETPDYVYFTSRNMLENTANSTYHSLFRYDKKGEEMMELSTSNILNGNTVADLIYNPRKGYLAVLYTDNNIDLLYNNGTVANISDYKRADMTYSKNVNSMSLDPDKDRIYLATDFGYVALNDTKYEVAESRIYGEPLSAFSRLGDKYVVLKDNKVLMADVGQPRLSLDQYTEVADLANGKSLIPMDENLALAVTGTKNNAGIATLKLTDNGADIQYVLTTPYRNIDLNQNGVLISTPSLLLRFNKDGSYDTVELPEDYRSSSVASSNLSEFWTAERRKGLSSIKKTGENWSVTRDWMLPNSPATYHSYSFANHPSKGFLTLSYGYGPSSIRLYSLSPMQLSGYKQGKWTNFSPAYRNPERTTVLTLTNGMVLDPDNSSYAYISSYHEGFMRLNLDNPDDIIHFARQNDSDNKNEGFVPLDFFSNSMYATITHPYFDAAGNLWMCFTNGNDKEEPNPHYIVWTAEDRKATTSAKNVRLPKNIEFDVYAPYNNLQLSIPLLKTGKGLHVYSCMGDNRNFVFLLDAGTTPLDMSDDKVYSFEHFIDSDGNELEMGRIRYMWEDPSTGYVWLCHQEGLCYFVPSKVLAGDYTLYRVKVPRNDGTNLADYLLEGSNVNFMTADGDGRKWFAINGGGVVCTSSDGREILEEFNTSNSLLPSDDVIGIGYNSSNNSMFFSTSNGYAEYNLPAAQAVSTKADVKAYPNPVRPEYSGYVTITDIPQGSFVKITDSYGHLVKELGVMTGFELLWDISDSNFNRVKAGVYHIMVSPSDENSSYSAVGKILVVS